MAEVTPAANREPHRDITASLAQKLSDRELPRYLAVEGPIGVGKTTLATLLADTLRYPLLLEGAEENPFLDRFYRDSRHQALPTQLYFLIHRARQMGDLPGRDDLLGPTLVADFMIEKDDLFARMTLDEQEYALYRQIHEKLAVTPPIPDLVIYLQAPAAVLRERIARRGVPYEQSIQDDYLNTLSDAYAEFFHFYDAAPLLVVNAAEIDLTRPAHFEALLDRALAMEGPRQYFNPNPTLL